jgi:hypothetical protein
MTEPDDCGYDEFVTDGPEETFVKLVPAEVADQLRADNERLRTRIHEIADDIQRRMAPYQARCSRFDAIARWARDDLGVLDSRFWNSTSSAVRHALTAIVEERDQARAEIAILVPVGRLYLDALDADPEHELLTLPEAIMVTAVRDVVEKWENA